jgi:energy-coupling factor transporter ATP-binding protein EcfA2
MPATHLATEPYASHAIAYFERGWWPIPAGDANGKKGIPSGYTGHHGKVPTRTDIDKWVADQPDANIALRLPPDMVAIDVDAYGDKDGARTLADLQQQLGQLPPTWAATARQLPSAKYLYRVPVGTKLRSIMGAGIDVCQHHHRYVIAAPSVHSTGATVAWIDTQSGEVTDQPPDPDDIPQLPWAWLEHFSTSGSAETCDAANEQAVDQWIERCTHNLRPKWLDATVRRFHESVLDGNARHDSMLAALCSAARETEAGAFTANDAVLRLAKAWDNATAGEHRDAEFADMVAWAVGQLDTDKSRAEVEAKRQRLTITAVADEPPKDAPGLHIPAGIWQSRPSLAHIHAAALARMTPPDAVLHAVLARVAALTSHTVEIPPNVGSGVGLSYMTMLVGKAGHGKSTAISAARDLLPPPAGHNIADGLPIGSGEGLAEVLFDTVEEPDPDTGKKVKVRRQVRHQALVAVDEGTLLAELGQRKGTTVLSTLRTIYTHGTIGNTNASQERKRVVPGDRYVYGLIVGIQPDLAGPLLDPVEVAAGTPQRFSWVWCVDETLTPDPHPWPGEIDWEPPTASDLSKLERVISNGAAIRHRIPVPDAVTQQVRNEIHRGRTTEDVDPLDAHIMLQRLKVAALVGILDGRVEVSHDDWELAGVIVDTSCRVRNHVIATLRAAEHRSEAAQVSRLVRREAASEDAATQRALASATKSIANKVRKVGRCPRRDLTQAIASKHRKLITVDEAIDKAVAEGLIKADGDHFVPGRRTP